MTVAAAPLIAARAPMSSRSIGVPEIGKFSTARCVWARHLAQRGHADLAHGVVLDAVLGAVLLCGVLLGGHAALPVCGW